MPDPMMRVVAFSRYGDSSVLELGERAVPAIRPGEVLVRVAAAGVNPADVKWRAGMFASSRPLSFPHVPGYDVSGVVAKSDEPNLPVGARVAAILDPLRQGGYAEYAAVGADRVAIVPSSVGEAVAAAVPTPGLTGVQLIEEQLDAQPGQTVLLTGATGAVGRFALHAALRRGVRVVAAVRAAQRDLALQLGASAVIALGETSWDGAAFDHVADTVGGAAVADLCRHLRPDGRIRTVSTTPVRSEGLSTTPIFFPVHPDAARLAQLLEAIGAGTLEMPLTRQLPLAEAAEAHRLIDSGAAGGKIVLLC